MLSACILLSLAARGTVLTEAELLASGYHSGNSLDEVVRFPVDSFPLAMLPAGAWGLELIPLAEHELSVELLAAATVKGGWIVLDTLVYSAEIDISTFVNPSPFKSWAWWDTERSVLNFATQRPWRMLTHFYEWTLSGDGFKLDACMEEDPSDDALWETLLLLDSGRVEEASRSIFGVLYPQYYYDGGEMAALFLRASSREARRLAGLGQWREALDVYMCAGEAYLQCGLDSLWFLDASYFEANGNPVWMWLEDGELVEILEHFSAVASETGDGALADSALRAASSLPRS